MNVYQRLNAARRQFHTLELKKSGHNKFAGYYYFELGDFLIPALTVFAEHGLCAVVSFDADKACMLIRNTEAPEEIITIYSPMGSAALKGCHEVQNIGAVETYQRRYLWVAALEIVEHDALDAMTEMDKDEASKPTKKTAANAPKVQDTSPKAAAQRIAAGVAAGDAAGAADAMSGWEKARLESVWALLDAATQDKLTAAWPNG